MLPIIVTLVEVIVLSFVLTGVLLIALLGLRVLPGLSKEDSLYSIFRALVGAQEERPRLYVRDSQALAPVAAAFLVPMYYLSAAAAQAIYDITIASAPTIQVADQGRPSDSAPNLVVPLPA